MNAHNIGLVSTLGPNRGSATIYIDGVKETTFNLNAAATRYRQVVFTAGWKTLSSHTVLVVVTGTRGHPRVDVDAFVVLD